MTTIAKNASMDFTAKHHGGFSMFDSQHTPCNIGVAAAFKWDITRELSFSPGGFIATYRVELRN